MIFIICKILKYNYQIACYFGDKGYLSQTVQFNLFNEVNIQLETPKRKNQKDYHPQFYPFKKHRKRIETLFSQLCDQFMIRRN